MTYLVIACKNDVDEMFRRYPNVLVNSVPDNTPANEPVVYSAFIQDSMFEADITPSMIEYITGMPNTRLVCIDINKHTIYVLCLRSLYILNSLRVNRGFPKDMHYKQLVEGAVVEVCWRDSEPSIGIVIDVDHHAHNYVGERSFKMLDLKGGIQRCVQTQIIELVDSNGLHTLQRLRIQTDTLVAIAHIAANQKNKKLQQISELAESAING